MMNESPFQLRVSLVSGAQHEFVQDDGEVGARNLGRINPDTVFEDPVLVVHTPPSVTTFRTKEIVRLDFGGSNPPEWAHAPGVRSVQEMSSTEFDSELSRFHRDPTVLESAVDGEVVALIQLELEDGAVMHLRVETQAAPEALHARLFRDLLQRTHLLVRSGEHAILINPARVCSVTAVPGPSAIGYADLLAR